eukprot:11682547-Alexandrium_andersonii.AAC.1
MATTPGATSAAAGSLLRACGALDTAGLSASPASTRAQRSTAGRTELSTLACDSAPQYARSSQSGLERPASA